MKALEAELEFGRIRKSVREATEAFITAASVEPSTLRKYRRVMNRLATFADDAGVVTVDALRLDHLDDYKRLRKLCDLSWQKELQLLRGFLDFCLRRKWCEENVAKDMKMPRKPKPRPREPYTQQEIIAIFAAADTFGLYAYERLRARAALLLMRYYGLRISDVATLRRDRIKNGQLSIQAVKNGRILWFELFHEVQVALEALPLPKGASADCPYFFWTGKGNRDGHIKRLDKTLQAVYRKSGVPGRLVIASGIPLRLRFL
jgi:site-specific recombinase XerC